MYVVIKTDWKKNLLYMGKGGISILSPAKLTGDTLKSIITSYKFRVFSVRILLHTEPSHKAYTLNVSPALI